MSTRHEKWVPVELGTVIPAGQPYRWEWPSNGGTAAEERVADYRTKTVPHLGTQWFIDSSWKAPLELSTEPTWGIVVARGLTLAEWHLDGDTFVGNANGMNYGTNRADVRAFVRLSPEQVAHIEAKR